MSLSHVLVFWRTADTEMGGLGCIPRRSIDCDIYSMRLFKHNLLMPIDYGLYNCCYERKNRTPMNDDADYDRKQLPVFLLDCTATTSKDFNKEATNQSTKEYEMRNCAFSSHLPFSNRELYFTHVLQ